MIGAVHASIGAALGALLGNKAGAFAAGVASHVVADLIPHKDYPPKVEAPLLIGALAGIAAWRGPDSPEFWGALGAVTPDSEHALLVAGLITSDQQVFPTHIKEGRYHGRAADRRWGQLLTAAVAVGIVVLCSGDCRTAQPQP